MTADPNPYSPPHDVPTKSSAAVRGSLFKFAQKIFAAMAWAIFCLFSSAVALGLFTGIYIAMTLSNNGQPTQTVVVAGKIGAFLPMTCGLAALILGLLGKLPGTRR